MTPYVTIIYCGLTKDTFSFREDSRALWHSRAHPSIESRCLCCFKMSEAGTTGINKLPKQQVRWNGKRSWEAFFCKFSWSWVDATVGNHIFKQERKFCQCFIENAEQLADSTALASRIDVCLSFFIARVSQFNKFLVVLGWNYSTFPTNILVVSKKWPYPFGRYSFMFLCICQKSWTPINIPWNSCFSLWWLTPFEYVYFLNTPHPRSGSKWNALGVCTLGVLTSRPCAT